MPKTVMTVDDSATIRQNVSFVLEDAGYEIVEAVDGKEAFDKIQANPVDLVISDVHMPNMNGIELTKAIRAHAPTKFTPVVLLTTESQPEKKMEGKAAGATGWIVKPFQPEQLLTVVKKLCPL